MTSERWIFPLLFLFAVVSDLIATPNPASAFARMPLSFEGRPGAELVARQGSVEVTLAAGSITTRMLGGGSRQRAAPGVLELTETA